MFHFAVASVLFIVALACEPSPRDNVHDQPKRWCSINARLTTGQRPCDLDVEEALTVPWVPRTLSRVLITPMGRIDLPNIAASQVIKTTHVPVVAKPNEQEPRAETLRINVTLEASQPSTTEASFVLRYTIINGLRIFDHCKLDDGKFNQTSGTLMAMWQPGIVAPHVATRVSATFNLPYRHVLHNPPVYGVPPPAKRTLTDRASDVEFNTTKYDGTTAFYVRFTPRDSSPAAKCSGYRMCDNELRARKQKPPSPSVMGVRLWLALGCSMLLAAFIVALVVVCCLRRGKAGNSTQTTNTSQFSAQHAGAAGFREKDDKVDPLPRGGGAEEVYIKDVTSANAGGSRFGWNTA